MSLRKPKKIQQQHQNKLPKFFAQQLPLTRNSTIPPCTGESHLEAAHLTRTIFLYIFMLHQPRCDFFHLTSSHSPTLWPIVAFFSSTSQWQKCLRKAQSKSRSDFKGFCGQAFRGAELAKQWQTNIVVCASTMQNSLTELRLRNQHPPEPHQESHGHFHFCSEAPRFPCHPFRLGPVRAMEKPSPNFPLDTAGICEKQQTNENHPNVWRI